MAAGLDQNSARRAAGTRSFTMSSRSASVTSPAGPLTSTFACADAPAWAGVADLSPQAFSDRHGLWNGPYDDTSLFYYLDEFVFRFNRRKSASRGLLFYRLLQQAVVTEPVTYGDVVMVNC